MPDINNIFERLAKKGKLVAKSLSQNDLEVILNELQVYEAELIAQNDELQESNEKLQISQQENIKLFKNAPISYVILNEYLFVTRYNYSALKLFDFSYVKSFMDFVPFIEKENFENWIKIADKLPIKELVLKTKEGKHICRLRVSSIYVETKEKRYLLSIENIQKEKEYEQELERLVKQRTQELELSKKELETANQELYAINKNLEQRISEAVIKMRKKDKLLFQQSKLAAMGEMIGAIAHQWKQPLAGINSYVAKIYTFLKQKKLLDELKEELDRIEDLTQHMANTIEDFRSYINPNKKKEWFCFGDINDELNNIFFSMPHASNISIVTDKMEHSMPIYGYKQEFIQVILVLYNNAFDAFQKNHVKEPTISLASKSSNTSISIEIADNAGGIEEGFLPRLFEPHFSTKENFGDSGIGLYIAKMIIEESMQGSINIGNIEYGALVTITLPNNK
jgi:C4-dicarboxylate-specific signal transduction histidine kinase